MIGSIEFTGHQHRLHALEMLLISMHTQNPALRGRYERLSELWLALAERRERMGSADGADPQTPTADIAVWMPIGTAPQQEEIRVLETVWGPRIWLRNGARVARARWRAEAPPDTHTGDAAALRAGGWEDLDGGPLTFVPKEWRELES